MSDPTRLVVQAVVELKWLRNPATRTEQVAKMLRAVAANEVKAYSGWGLGGVEYKAEVWVPAGVIPRDRPHPLDGRTATDATLDALLALLDQTPFNWTVVATAEVIRNG